MLANWLISLRIHTLPASAIPVGLAGALALLEGPPDLFRLSLILLCAGCLQIAVNLANEYSDFRRGVDGPARKGPVRGLQSGQISLVSMRRAIALSCLTAAASGLVLLVLAGNLVLWLLGALSLLAVFAYSSGPRPLASLGLGEITVFFFFGPLPVCGGFYLLTAHVSSASILTGLACGSFAAAIMATNNLRDIQEDAEAGKVTLAVRLGETRMRWIYCLLLVLPTPLAAWAFLQDPGLPDLFAALLPLIMAGPALLTCQGAFARQGALLNRQLAATVRLYLLFGFSTIGLLLMANHAQTTL